MSSQSTPSTPSGNRPLVFVSYSHADSQWLDRLRVHLKPLERHGTIALWDDTRIKPGTEWREEIRSALERARVAVLLVTADFLASDFIQSNELPPLLKSAEQHGTLILPLIVKPCRFEKTEGLARFQAVNSPSEPLVALRAARRERLFVKLSETIEDALKSAEAEIAPPKNSETSEFKRSNRPEPAEPERSKKVESPRHALRYRFWQQLLKLANEKGVTLHANRAPTREFWIGAGAGKSGYSWNYMIWMNDAGVELYIDLGDRSENKRVFDTLQSRKGEIETSFGRALKWNRLNEKRGSKIVYRLQTGGLLLPEAEWPALQAAMVDAMARLVSALQPHLSALASQAKPQPEPVNDGPSGISPTEFRHRTETLDEQRLETSRGKRGFIVHVREDGLEFTPESSGMPRLAKWQQIGHVLSRYNETRSLTPGDYHDITHHSSYLVAILRHLLSNQPRPD